MVRDLVMRVRHAFQETEIDAAHRVAEHERADPRRVALKRQRDHIHHQADVLLMRRRSLRRLCATYRTTPAASTCASDLPPVPSASRATVRSRDTRPPAPGRWRRVARASSSIVRTRGRAAVCPASPNRPPETPPETGARRPTADSSPAPAESSDRSRRYGTRTLSYIRRSHPHPSIRARSPIRAKAAASRRPLSAPPPGPSKVREC